VHINLSRPRIKYIPDDSHVTHSPRITLLDVNKADPYWKWRAERFAFKGERSLLIHTRIPVCRYQHCKGAFAPGTKAFVFSEIEISLRAQVKASWNRIYICGRIKVHRCAQTNRIMHVEKSALRTRSQTKRCRQLIRVVTLGTLLRHQSQHASRQLRPCETGRRIWGRNACPAEIMCRALSWRRGQIMREQRGGTYCRLTGNLDATDKSHSTHVSIKAIENPRANQAYDVLWSRAISNCFDIITRELIRKKAMPLREIESEFHRHTGYYKSSQFVVESSGVCVSHERDLIPR
jgi:hypothetical protein